METVVFKKLILGDFKQKISCKNKFWIATYSWPRLEWVSTSCALFCAHSWFQIWGSKNKARRGPKCAQKPKLICWKTGRAGPLNWFFDLLYGFILLLFLVESQKKNIFSLFVFSFSKKVFSVCLKNSCYVCATQLEALDGNQETSASFAAVQAWVWITLGERFFSFCTSCFACSLRLFATGPQTSLKWKWLCSE